VKTETTTKVRRNTGKRVRRRTSKPADGFTLYEQLKAFDGRADDLPVDLALQHDHYLYGTAKRAP
jgi:hypothetical protein